MKIRAAVARAAEAPLTIEGLELIEPRSDEVRVRMVAAGVCHTDIAMRDHKIYPIPYPAVLGHEGAGVVEAVGDRVASLLPGDHVVLTFGHCGRCPSCKAHQPSYCESFHRYNFEGTRGDAASPLIHQGEPVSLFQAQSSFATHSVCSEGAVVRVPRQLPLHLLAPLGCAVLTGAGAVINSLGVRAGQSVAIIGTGSVGLCAVMAAKMIGAETIIAIDRNERRLAIARQIGATHAVNSAAGSIEDAVRQIAPLGVDSTLETTANMELLRLATKILARRGACGFVGGIPKGTEVALDVEHMMTGGRTFRGIILGDTDPQAFVPTMASAIENGRFPVERIITTYPFEAINQAIADSLSGQTVKAVLLFD